MATGDKGEDPNQAYDDSKAKGSDIPNVSEADQWGTDLNPVREPATPFTNVNDGGSAAR